MNNLFLDATGLLAVALLTLASMMLVSYEFDQPRFQRIAHWLLGGMWLMFILGLVTTLT